MKNSENWRRRLVTASGIAAAGLACALPAMADPPVSMAPPVDGGYQQVVTESSVDGGSDSVFLWSEVPTGQEVNITRAVFDRGGYQLYDDIGETIVVPFNNNNLYVMKFAVSDNGHMYFVDDNGTPILFVPRTGYLENATVNGARWYPFTQDFHPAEPVFLGVAPSWNSFVTMGWYPDMYYRGGYWCHDAYVSGGIFEPSFGLEIVIGDNRFRGWTPYHNFYFDHPAPYRVGWYNSDRYQWAARPHGDRQFSGGGDHWSRSSRPTGPTNRWDTSRVGRTGGSYRVYQPEDTHSWTNRNDQGWSGGSRQPSGGRPSDTHTWRGTTSTGTDRWNGSGGGNRVFRGGTSTWSNGGGTGSGSSWRGGDRQYNGSGGSSWQRRSGGSFTPSGNGGDRRSNDGGSSWQGRSGGSYSTGNGGDRQFDRGSSWQGRSGGSFSTGGGSDRQSDRGSSSWQGRSGGSSTTGGGGRSSGGFSGWSSDNRSNDGGSSRGSGGGGRWTR